MRTLILFLFALFAYISSNAQDSQLLENEWYLQKVTIDDIELTSPSPSLVGRLYCYTENIEVTHPFCEEGFDKPIQYTSNNIFETDDGGVLLVGNCGNPDIIDFMNIHYSIYYDLDTEITKNPFSYSFTTENGILILTVVNSLGDSAIYSNEILSTQDFENESFNVFPNPVNDELFITSNSISNNYKIFIYSVNGKSILSLNNSELRHNSIDLQELKSGIYFIQIKGKQGQSAIKKFIKN